MWSLARIAASVLHPSRPALRAGLAGPAAPAWVQLMQMWPRMQAQALQMVVEMMSSCQLKVGGRGQGGVNGAVVACARLTMACPMT